MFDIEKYKINKGLIVKVFLYFFKTLRVLSFFIFLISVFYFIQGFVIDSFPLEYADIILFFAIISFSLFLIFFNLASFFDNYIKKTK